MFAPTAALIVAAALFAVHGFMSATWAPITAHSETIDTAAAVLTCATTVAVALLMLLRG